MGLPLSVFTNSGNTNYTPGALTALTAAIDVINETWAQGNAKLTSFENKISAITDETSGWLGSQSAPQISGIGTAATPSVIEPNVTIPQTIDTSTILAEYNAEYTALRATMVADLQKIFNDYFPNDSADYSAAEAWITGALANPNGGLPVAVQAQLMTDSKDRINAEAGRASEAVLATFAARRFPMPPGAANAAVADITMKAQDQIAEAERKITINSIEQMKFAVEKALSMREMAIGAALKYVVELASAPDISSKVVGIGHDAQTKLINAASAFFNARTDAQKLISSVNEFNVTTSLHVAEKNQAANMTMVEDKLKALLAEVQVFGQMATSLFNNLHASAGTGYSVSTS